MACFSLAEVVSATQARPVGNPALAALEGFCFSSVSTDTRTLSPGALFIALHGQKYDGQTFVVQAAQKGARGALLGPGPMPQGGVPPGFMLLEVEDTLKALGQLALFHRKRNPLPLGAITGSSGKTTTKELVASILRQRGKALATEGNLNNEIGLPLTLLGLSAQQHWAGVVEMGMSNPGEISRLANMALPDAGLISSIHPAHLAGLGSLEAVAHAKGELFEALPPKATALICLDEPKIVAQARRCVAQQCLYGKSPGADIRLVGITPQGEEGQHLRWEYQGKVVEAHLHLLGEHNALNATAALAMALVLGCDTPQCIQGIEAAKAVPRRLSLRQGPSGTRILDDCYNANPASMQAAIYTATQLASPSPPLLALGDMLELGTSEEEAHRQVGRLAAQYAHKVVFVGKRMRLAWEEAHPCLGEGAQWCEEAPEAVERLRGWLGPGEVLLVKASRSMRLERIVEALCTHEGDEACFMPSIPS